MPRFIFLLPFSPLLKINASRRSTVDVVCDRGAFEVRWVVDVDQVLLEARFYSLTLAWQDRPGTPSML